MNIFTIFFLDKIAAQCTPKHTIFLKKIFGGALPPNTPNTRVASTCCMALRAMQLPHFSKINLNPPEMKS